MHCLAPLAPIGFLVHERAWFVRWAPQGPSRLS